MRHEIVPLPKERWRNHILPMGYTSGEYYDVRIERRSSGCSIVLERKKFDAPVAHTPEEHNFWDRLYADWWPEAGAWGVLDEGNLLAAIETCPETWTNRLWITELWVDAAYRKQGLGRALMNVAKEQARRERRRVLILETQSCNVNAIDFYLRQGFSLTGVDTCCYSNEDMEKKEVRVELGWFPERGN